MDVHGLKKGSVKFPKKTLQVIVEAYTRESGVRELDKKIAKIMRKLARKVASDEPIPTSIKPEDLYEYLGAVEYSRDKYQGNDYAGVVTGLAWTAVGGEILFVESSLSKGKGSKLTLTGNLGDVMKESAMLALEYIHAHAAQFNINEELFENWNVHVHVPEGAIPKDGPSAGITMVTSLVSAFTRLISLISFSFSLQRINSLIPARLAAKIFSLIPPTGSTLPRNVISPVIAKFFFTLR